jgi:hypothetical protein
MYSGDAVSRKVLCLSLLVLIDLYKSLAGQDRIKTELHGQRSRRDLCIVDAVLRKESHQGLVALGDIEVENQLGKIKQR